MVGRVARISRALDRTFAIAKRTAGVLSGSLADPTCKENPMPPEPAAASPEAIARDVTVRAVTAVGLAGIALIHLLDAVGKYSETRYLFWMYIALIAASLVTAGAVIFTRSRAAFLAAAIIAASALAGFVLNRTTGLPHATDDIGNWTEPLGLASLFVEGVTLAVAAAALGLVVRTWGLAAPMRPELNPR